MIILIFKQVGISLLGIIIYQLLAFRKHLKTDTIRTKVFWKALWLESRIIWAWSLVTISSISIIINLAPESSEVIKTATGIDIANNLMSFVSLGLGLTASIDNQKR